MTRYADLHVHLYGCLTAEDLFQWATEHKLDVERLNWYADEYFKACGRRPDWSSYFNSESCIPALAQDYYLTTPATFEQFQARINLPIALCPPRPDSPGILPTVLFRHRAEASLAYCEYRVFLPHYFTKAERRRYLNTVAATCLEHETSEFSPRLAFSVARPNSICAPLIEELMTWQRDEPQLARAVTGIDFCGIEAGHPPNVKAELFKRIRAESSFQLLYHVGETLANLTPASMIRWIDQAARIGAHRLGHCTVLGITPDHFPVKSIQEPSAEAEATQSWLIENGLTKASLTEIQDFVMNRLADQKTVIECCPTSNLLLGGLSSLKAHPIKRFIKHNIPVVLGSDDPGIFQTSIANEYEIGGHLTDYVFNL